MMNQEPFDYVFLSATTEADKYKDNGKYFKDWNAYIITKYDTQRFRGNMGSMVGLTGTTNTGIPEWNYKGGSPVNAMWAYYAYFTQRQDNEKFGFITKDTYNNPMPIGSTWMRNSKISQLIYNFVGRTMGNLKYQEFDLRSITPATVNAKTIKFDLARIKRDNREVFEELEQQGVAFSPLGGAEDEFDTDEEFEDFKDNTYKENAEIECSWIMDDVKIRNRFTDYFNKCLTHASIGGVSATKPYVKNGKVWWRHYDGRDVIWDNSEDSTLHERDNFIGLIRRMTGPEIIDMYGDELLATPEGKEAYEKIKNGKLDTSAYSNTYINSTLNVLQDNNGVPQYIVVDAYWRALKDTRYVERKNEDYGSTYVPKLKDTDTDEKDSFWWETWYKCTTLGNLAIVDYGEETNLLENFDDKKIVEPRVVLFTPEMTDGYAQSLVGRMVQNADAIDFFRNLIIERARRSKGKVAFINGDVMNKTALSDIENDLQMMGMTVVTKMQGDDYVSDANSRLVEMVDLSATAEITLFSDLVAQQERIMEEITSANEITLGQKTDYISSSNQQSTLNQAQYGIFKYIEGFKDYICKVLQVSVNMQKNLVAESNDEYGVPVTSQLGQRFLKDIKNISLQDLQVYIRPVDPITEQMRSEIILDMRTLAQNPDSGVMPADISKLYMLKTVAEMQRHYERVTKRILKQQKEAQIAAAEQEAAMVQSQNDAMIASKEMEMAGKAEDSDKKIEGDILKELVKKGETV